MALNPQALIAAITRAGENEKRRKFLALSGLGESIARAGEKFNRNKQIGKDRKFQTDERIAGQDFRTQLEENRNKFTRGRDEQGRLDRAGEIKDAAGESRRRFDLTNRTSAFKALTDAIGGGFRNIQGAVENQQKVSRADTTAKRKQENVEVDQTLRRDRLKESKRQHAVAVETASARDKAKQFAMAKKIAREAGDKGELKRIANGERRTRIITREVRAKRSRIEKLEKNSINPTKTAAQVAGVQDEIDRLLLEEAEINNSLAATRIPTVVQPRTSADGLDVNRLLEDRNAQANGG